MRRRASPRLRPRAGPSISPSGKAAPSRSALRFRHPCPHPVVLTNHRGSDQIGADPLVGMFASQMAAEGSHTGLGRRVGR